MIPSDFDPLPGAKVLLVDDDPVIMMLAAAELRGKGMIVHEASSGEEALRRLPDGLPDVIVLDASMPGGMTGFETCRCLRALDIPGVESLPVLMLTGTNTEKYIEDAYKSGATDFLAKADDSRQNSWTLLVGRLRNLLRAARLQKELERSLSTLQTSRSRMTQVLTHARMGGFEWKGGLDSLTLSVEAESALGLTLARRTPDEGAGGHECVLPFALLADLLDRASFRRLCGHLRNDVRDGRPGVTLELTLHIPPLSGPASGRRVTVHVEADAIYDTRAGRAGRVIGYEGFLQDVTERSEDREKIEHAANFDDLTNLPNRPHLRARVTAAIRLAERQQGQFALLLIDLDRFKVVNDTLGHGAGDELLIAVANRLVQCVRPRANEPHGLIRSVEDVSSAALDDLRTVARQGGDEFVALLPACTQAEAEALAAAIIASVNAEPVMLQGQECFVTASVGIAMFPVHGTTESELLRHADVAMYAAKDEGRNVHRVFESASAKSSMSTLSLIAGLRRARERQELVLHYQPKVDVSTGRLIGAEALMRWRRHGQLVPPLEFIPLAEETGEIIEMTRWAIQQAARQARVWRDQLAMRIPVAVNVPSQAFERLDLCMEINDATSACGLDPGVITIEITENSVMRRVKELQPGLHRLQSSDVVISIDDFGTGYSSLRYLTELPIGELKIDRHFVETLRSSTAVVEAIIALGRSLEGVKVIAEGVEHAWQVQVLNRLGCHLIQGYHVARPMPPDDFHHWVVDVLLSGNSSWVQLPPEPPPPAPPAPPRRAGHLRSVD